MIAKKKVKNSSFIRSLLLSANLLFALLLILSYFAESSSPEDTWVLPFIGLAYPFLLMLNLIFLLYWMITGKYYFLLSLFVILSGLGFIGRYFQFSSCAQDFEKPEKAFKVLSFNVHNLTENNFRKLTERQNDIFNHVIKESPDIVCMQEFYSQGENYYYPLVNLKENLNAENYYYQSYYNPYRFKIVGMVIFSKFKRIHHGYLSNDAEKKFGIFADFVHLQDTFRVYNLHLESIYLQRSDYDMVTGKTAELGKENISNRLNRITGKLKQAFTNRARQVEYIRKEIENCPYPVIICGDFNDTPSSYAYHVLTKDLQDAFIESGRGMGKTFSSIIPFFRIDYILFNRKFVSSGYREDQLNISDHYPVSCFLSLEN